MGPVDPYLPAWLAFDGGPDAEPARTTLGGASARTRAGLFDALATVLPLPDHFGRNWDALADVLAERLDSGPLTLVVRDAGELLADEPPAQLGILLDVLGGVAAGRHHSLRVLLRDRADRLPALRHRIVAALGGQVGVPPTDLP